MEINELVLLVINLRKPKKLSHYVEEIYCVYIEHVCEYLLQD